MGRLRGGCGQWIGRWCGGRLSRKRRTILRRRGTAIALGMARRTPQCWMSHDRCLRAKPRRPSSGGIYKFRNDAVTAGKTCAAFVTCTQVCGAWLGLNLQAMSELQRDWRAPTGLRSLRGLRRRVADRRLYRFDRLRTRVGHSVGLARRRRRRRRLDRLRTMCMLLKRRRGRGNVFRHVSDPRYAFYRNAARAVPLPKRSRTKRGD